MSGEQSQRERYELDSDWMVDAQCKQVDPEIFFPHDGSGLNAAQRVCGQCVVIELCLEYALQGRIDHGVWGGASERERRRILRSRRANSPA